MLPDSPPLRSRCVISNTRSRSPASVISAVPRNTAASVKQRSASKCGSSNRSWACRSSSGRREKSSRRCAARRYCRQAEALLGDARRLLEDARRSSEPLSGELRLGVIATLGPYYMPSVIALGRRALSASWRCAYVEAKTDELLVALRHGELDAILVALPVADGRASSPSRSSSNRSASHVRANTNSPRRQARAFWKRSRTRVHSC